MFPLSALLIRKCIAIRSVLNVCSKVPLLNKLTLLFIDSEGFRYYAEAQNWWRFAKPFEPLTHEFLIRNVEKDDVFLDIGAHIGMYAIKMSRRVSEVIALEPEPRTYSLLCRNILINSVSDKVIALPIAASDRDGYRDLCVTAETGGHILEDLRECMRKIKVVSLKVDTLLKKLNIDKVDVVKIGAEGHEDKVVAGMFELLNQSPPRILVVEIRRKNLNLLDYFTSIGYKITLLDCWLSSTNYGFYLVKRCYP